MTEEVYGWKYEKSIGRTHNFPLEKKLNNWEEVYQFVKDNDTIGYWLNHYHNVFGEEDGTYLENMFFTLRRRYKKPFNRFYPKPKYIYE